MRAVVLIIFGVCLADTPAAAHAQRDCTAAVAAHTPAGDDLAEVLLYIGTTYVLGGDKIPKNPVFGVSCIRGAADGGNRQALLSMGALYAHGTGVLQDPVRAYKWSSLAAMYGVDHAAQYRDQIAEQLTAAEVAEGRRLAQEWLEREQ